MDGNFYFSELFNLLNSEIQKAKNEIFIAAPYVKMGIVKKIHFPQDSALKITFVCRWKLEDVLAGATDIGVYPLLRDQGISVLLHPNLHAKYYRSDSRILMGSANLTSNGLTNDESSSLEALTLLLHNSATVNFESKLIQESVEVDDVLYSEYLEILSSYSDLTPVNELNFYWPSFTSLEEAWALYNQDRSSVSLKQLSIPPTLEKSKFKGFIKLRLKEFTNIQRIERFLESGLEGRRFGEVRGLIREMDESVDETSAWQNLMSLLLDLFPESYEYYRPNHTEIIISKKMK